MNPIKSIVAASTRGLWLGLLLLWVVGPSVAAESPSDPPKDPGKVFILPFEIDFDSGAANGDAIISRLIPVNTLLVRDKWRLINLAMVVIADAPGGRPGQPGNPESVPGPNAFGLGDITDAVLYTRQTSKGLMWGIGVAFGIPSATDEVLGSGKWLAGPALRLGHQIGPWRLGLLATTRWSFAGDSDRADVNQLLVRALVRRTLPKNWFFLYDPIITANWDAASGQKWLVPVGGGFGRSFKLHPTRMNVSLQAYYNAIKPDGAPDSVVRIGFTFPFQVPGKS